MKNENVLEAQLISITRVLLTYNVTFSFVDHIYIVDRYPRPLRFCNLEFVKEAIYDIPAFQRAELL